MRDKTCKCQAHNKLSCVWNGHPQWLIDKESACNAGDTGLVPGPLRSPGEGNGNPVQYFCLENPMDRGAWQATLHGAARVGHDLATKQPPLCMTLIFINLEQISIRTQKIHFVNHASFIGALWDDCNGKISVLVCWKRQQIFTVCVYDALIKNIIQEISFVKC